MGIDDGTKARAPIEPEVEGWRAAGLGGWLEGCPHLQRAFERCQGITEYGAISVSSITESGLGRDSGTGG